MWQSPDPILGRYLDGKPNGGVQNPPNLNLFAYTHLNPIKYIDPNGLSKSTLEKFEKQNSDIKFYDNLNKVLFVAGLLSVIVPWVAIITSSLKFGLRVYRQHQRRGVANSTLEKELRQERESKISEVIENEKEIVREKYTKSIDQVMQWKQEISYMYVDMLFDLGSIAGGIITSKAFRNDTTEDISLGITGFSLGYSAMYFLFTDPGSKDRKDFHAKYLSPTGNKDVDYRVDKLKWHKSMNHNN